MGPFDSVRLAPPDPILGLTIAFNEDRRANKINLSVGVYKTPDLKTPIMHVVKEEERRLWEKENSKEYLPIDGDKIFLNALGKLVFGGDLWKELEERIAKFQALGGTGALRLGGDFLYQHVTDTLYVSDPSWPNHVGVFSQCGFKVGSYPYYNMHENRLEFDALHNFLSTLPENTAVVLHASCHNPSGIDPSYEEWKKLADLFVSKKLIAFFDAAYLGFDGSVEQDAQIIRLFASCNIPILLAVSLSKNFALYAERVGALYVLASNKEVVDRITSQVKISIRRNYSNPPLHGARIVREILSDPVLKKQWEEELLSMRQRIAEMRKAFSSSLQAKVKTKNYEYLSKTKGLFCFCNLQKEQVERLKRDFGIYMTMDGRINLLGLNHDNLEYVADAIAKVM